MAFSSGKFVTTFTLIGTGGRTVIREYENYDTDYGFATAAAVAMAVRLNNCSNLKIASYSLSFVKVEQSLVLPTNAYPEEQLLINAPIKGKGGKRAQIKIPAPKDVLFQSTTGQGHNLMNAGNATLLDFLLMFDQAYFKLSDGEQIDRNDLRGKRVHRTTIGK